MSKAVFLDRDGVIVEDVGYHYKIEDFKFVPNAVDGLRLLKNYKLFIITNQSGIGRGHYTIKDFENFNNHLIGELNKSGINIEKTYVCPHKPDDSCECRKPNTKFLKDAEKEFGLNLRECFVIGDKEIDIEMGKNAGCTAILVNGTSHKVKPDFTAKDLVDAAWWILECQH